jgi:hypothetical protein
MTAFASKRCFVHSAREAVCLCTICRKSFCRECVIEQEQRLVCAACMSRSTAAKRDSRAKLDAVQGTGSVLLAILLAWVFFYMAGRIFLLAEPSRHTFSESPVGSH